MGTHTLKIARATEESIDELRLLLNEISNLHDELQYTDLDSIDFSNFEILSNFDKSDAESFLEAVLKELSYCQYTTIILNMGVLLDNCADLQKDTLDFNPDIKKGFKLLHERETANDFSLEYCI